jgi:hypothetical protein
MAVGLPAKTTYVDGDVFSASDINDTNGTLNLVGQTTNFYAGKNKVINGDFGIWQRGSSIALTNNVTSYVSDRFRVYSTFSAGSTTFSRQTFTPGAAPVAGYEGEFFGRLTMGSTSTYFQIEQPIEDVRTFANQQVTFSFWAKAGASVVVTPSFFQAFGSGGSGGVGTTGSNITLTTSWARYTSTVTIPSVSGKTIGSGSFLALALLYASGTINSATIDTWGWQLEAGAAATAFETATGTIQGELAACQRYFYNITSNLSVDNQLGPLSRSSTTFSSMTYFLPVTMRTTPTIVATPDGSGNFFRSVEYDTSFNLSAGGITAVGIGSILNSQAIDLTFTRASSLAGTSLYQTLDLAGIASKVALSSEL